MVERGGKVVEEFSWDEQEKLLVPLGLRKVPLNVISYPISGSEATQPIADIDLLFLKGRGSDESIGIRPGERRLMYERRVYGRLLNARELAKSLAFLEHQAGTQPEDYAGERILFESRQELEARSR